MRGMVVPMLVGVLLLGACGGHGNKDANTSEGANIEPRGEPIVFKTTMVIAATAGSEPIATGKVIDGSTLAGSPFCAGGTIRDSHGSTDPTVPLIARTITCPDGTIRIDFTPELPQGLTQKGSWRVTSGTGAFERLRGTGKSETVYDPDDDSLARETFTGTVTR